MPLQGASTRNPKTFSSSIGPGTAFPSPIFSQIFPSRIHLFDQRNLPAPAPAFQLQLAALCRIHVIIFLRNTPADLHLYFLVNPSISPDLCWKMRVSTKPVMPRGDNLRCANLPPTVVPGPATKAELINSDCVCHGSRWR